MTDIVKRLRAASLREARVEMNAVLQDAAHEIEKLRRLLHGASKAIDKALDFDDGDVFGIMHNAVVDLDSGIKTALKKEDK